MQLQTGSITINCNTDCEPLRFATGELNKYNGGGLTVDVTVDETMSIKSQVYRLRLTGEASLSLSASDAAGAMYGLLDIARLLSHEGREGLRDRDCEPFIQNRGIKFNIPLDARTPSYSDESDSAQRNIATVWERPFWTEILDELARSRYNAVSLWSLNPFPSLVYVPEYPAVSLADVKRTTRPFRSGLRGQNMSNASTLDSLITLKTMTVEEKIEFWRDIMEYARGRCIRFYWFTWNLFSYGTEGNPYGIDNRQDNPVTLDYFKKATAAAIRTYPLLAGIGVTSGEQMTHTDFDIEWLRKSYAAGVEAALADEPDREFTFIHRLQFAKANAIRLQYSDYPHGFAYSFKYSQAHMHSAEQPVFIEPFLASLGEGDKTWLTVRSDDCYMFRWGDPDFARAYLKGMPHARLAGFFMGPDGYTLGREFLSRDANVYGKPVTVKMWYEMAIWGWLAYDIGVADTVFQAELALRLEAEPEPLFHAWAAASRIISVFQRTHWRAMDFQWYPEGCCAYFSDEQVVRFGDINEFIACESAPGSGCVSVSDYVRGKLNGTECEGKTPIETAEEIEACAGTAIAYCDSAGGAQSRELRPVLGDIRGLAYLGRYYAVKIRAAVMLCEARARRGEELQKQAVALLREAYDYWREYAAHAHSLYKPQYLTRFKQVIDLERFADDAALDIALAEEKF